MIKKTAEQKRMQPGGRNCLQYTPWQEFLISKLLNNKSRKFTCKELMREYRLKTNKKTSRQTLQKQLKSLPEFIKTVRKEQLWCFYDAPPTKMKPSLCMAQMDHRLPPTKQRNLMHSSHRWRFSISYKGSQPIEGADNIKPFGRYRTAHQASFSFENLTVITFKNKLNVWIHRPTGKLTPHQRIEAVTKARMALLQFAKERKIQLQGNVEEVMSSHHVVEQEGVNETLKPVFEAHQEEIKEVLGSHICQTSHPGKIEHTGNGEDVTGFQVAKGLEKLILETPTKIENLEKKNQILEKTFERLEKGLVKYSENLDLHIDVQRSQKEVQSETLKTLKKMQEKMEKY